MTCAEFRELASLYAVGGLDAAQRAEAESHLAEQRHEGCFEALRRASGGAEALARSLVPARPDDRIWKGIEARLGAEGAQPRSGFMTWRERAAWGIAAAAALLLFASLTARRQELRRADGWAAARDSAERAREQCLREISSLKGEAEAQRAAIALLQSPTVRVVSFEPQPGAPPYAARALLDLPARKGIVLSSTLAPSAGKDYQLWILRGQQPPAPAGLLRAGPSGTVLAPIDPQLLAAAPDGLAVSVEPQGGSPTGSPTGAIVLTASLKT